ncbi:hypothetical protein HYU10_04790 [Candidatus Woesearchaeota archaeon]|nr:hypothetical protein [Candidatus Woesearchaeota archaeon]MBI2131057.1 hypothetical protein [Candidatus Woesearchaeota archaeon]
MKAKISITMDMETVEDINNEVASGRFRNRSHAVEFALKQLLEDEDGRE